MKRKKESTSHCHTTDKDERYNIKSQFFYNIHLGNNMIHMERSIVLKLLKSPFDSPEGIVLTEDMPYQKISVMNIERPAVLRTYYGITTKAVSSTKLERFTYGSTELYGPLSIDPRQFTTKPMSLEMENLGKALKQYAKTN